MTRRRVLFLMGTRPEVIKLAPVIHAARAASCLDVQVCMTGQHAHMTAPMLEHFDITPDASLRVRRTSKTLSELVGLTATSLGRLIQRDRPDWLVVQGDTTTTLVGALCGFYERVPVAHVEAGLRSWDFNNPFPEELNRRAVSLAARLHFCPTRTSASNLIREGIDKKNIVVVGNTVIDALLWTLSNKPLPSPFKDDRFRILVTSHRRENWGEGIQSICTALREIVRLNPRTDIIFPVHKNPVVRNTVTATIGDDPRIRLLPPMDYPSFCSAMKHADLVITDSGGVQEETLALGIPTLVTRTVTERPEVLVGGTVRLVGTDKESLIQNSMQLMTDARARKFASRRRFPFGRGDAAKKIVGTLASRTRNHAIG